ncbi:hypothetical protein MMC34_004433 [Xylographa carneopallida]|nr:hypothetical protein [Xylographa carneopallida]
MAPAPHGQNSSDSDALLRACWRIQDCGNCLRAADPCSWCPVSSTCVPNPSHLPLLAPCANPNICPLWYERYELRAKGTGCHVSTITFFTALGAVLVTVVLGGVGWAVGTGVRLGWRRWKGRREGWWRWREWGREWKRWRLGLVDLRREEREEREGRWLMG